MELSAATYAFIKIGFVFVFFLVALRLKIDLWLTILGGCACVFLLSPMSLADFGHVFATVPIQKDFINLMVMLFIILALSTLQSATGQNRRLVLGLEKFLRWPKLRLMLFPALVGLLPMPGGALFSCPMLDDAARNIKLSGKRKVLINYWFRHIWELSWPLYPGYILLSSLLNIPLTTLMFYNFPLVIISFLVGWFIILKMPEQSEERDETNQQSEPSNQNSLIAKTDMPEQNAPNSSGAGAVFYESLPLLVTFGGALVVSLFFKFLQIDAPSQWSFMISTTCAVVISFLQGRKELKKPLLSIFFNANMCKILLLVFAIFCFKEVIGASGLVQDISSGSSSTVGIFALFLILPFIGGLLTGIMVGYVGSTFPILLGLAAHLGQPDHLLLLVMLGLISGNAGQLLTPIHVCMVVSCSFFKANITDVLKALPKPILVLATLSIIWAVLIFFLGARL